MVATVSLHQHRKFSKTFVLEVHVVVSATANTGCKLLPECYQKYAFRSRTCPSHPDVPGSGVLRGKSGGTVVSTVVTNDADQPVWSDTEGSDR